MSTVKVILSTTNSLASAQTIARQVVTNKVAACVNIIPKIHSIYEWEGKINEDEEVLMVIKTSTERVEQLIKEIKSVHPYSVPEVLALDTTAGNSDYIDWVLKKH